MKTYLIDNTSEVDYFVFEGYDEFLTSSFRSGIREYDYKKNGVSTRKIEFGVLTFCINKTLVDKSTNYYYELKNGDQIFDGILEINPFDKSLVADISKILDPSKDIFVTLKFKDKIYNLKLKNVSNSFKLNYVDIYNILIKKYNKELESFAVNNKFLGEIYLKIISENEYENGVYYWYVSVISVRGDFINLLIDPLSGEVLSSNNNLIDKIIEKN